MSSINRLCIGMVVLAVSACSTAPIARNTTPNDVQVAAQKLVGQPAQAAFAVFGKPDQGIGPSPYASSGGFYAWNRIQTHTTPEKVFVQTGVEYVGQRQTYLAGATGIMPVGTENIYRKTGYEENRTVIDYFCSITAFTDNQDMITEINVINCNEKK